ncbi:MAG TPA: polysaccharide deacetylase family protein [Puia sp.]|nr:polysaccharide deacetylase family protein [Puia sp.]
MSKKIAEKGFSPSYPGNKKMAVCVSHDIDHLFQNISSVKKINNAAKHFLRGRFNNSISSVKSIIKKEIDPGNSLKALAKINGEFNINSSYYFLSLDKADEDYNYDLKEIKNELGTILQNNCEVGLHGGHHAYNNKDKLLLEKNNLEKNLRASVKGYRNHYLRFQSPLTWNNLAEAGFLYDTTFGYADCAGFRNGMCYPFFPYDTEKNKFIEIVELPLMMMDATLIYYMRLDEQGSMNLCKKMVEEVAECNGVFTLLWHNNFLGGETGKLYRKILELLSAYDPWFATSAEIVEWWKEKNLLSTSQNIIEQIFVER